MTAKGRLIKLAFIGAGSTIFMKNIVGDMLHFEALRDAEIALDGYRPRRLDESRMVAEKMIATMGTGATVEATTDRARALDGADFVVTAFQIGGYRPSTVIDFDIPEAIRAAPDHRRHAGRGRHHAGASDRAASLGRGRGHGAALPRCAAAAIREPDGDQHLGPGGAVPASAQAGLCHSVQNTVEEIAHDLDLPARDIRYRVAG
jgi:alpha-galactosidase